MLASGVMTSTKTPKKPRYANALSAQVAAVVNGLYRFREEAPALARLAQLRTAYTHASEQEDDARTLTLWIRNFEVSEDEEQAGFLGHYATLRVVRMKNEDAHYTLTATKIMRELKTHPVRKRPAARCPNWGHPVLRSVLKGKEYANIHEAADALEALHLEYPETTIPGDSMSKLYLMIFSRRDNPKQPIEKYILEVKNRQGGGFIIESRKNTFTATNITPPKSEDGAAPASQGHFASMVALKKRKRKPGA